MDGLSVSEIFTALHLVARDFSRTHTNRAGKCVVTMSLAGSGLNDVTIERLRVVCLVLTNYTMFLSLSLPEKVRGMERERTLTIILLSLRTRAFESSSLEITMVWIGKRNLPKTGPLITTHVMGVGATYITDTRRSCRSSGTFFSEFPFTSCPLPYSSSRLCANWSSKVSRTVS